MNSTPSNKGSGTAEVSVHFLDYWRIVSLRWPLILLVFLLVVMSAGVVTYLMPRQYASQAVLQIRSDGAAINIFGQPNLNRMDPRFVSTQFEIIQRKEILDPVITNLNLQERWGLPHIEATYYDLRRMLDMREVRNTDLVEILVYNTDPNEAAAIANAIAEEYRRQRIANSESLVGGSLKQLEDEVNKQKATVDALLAEMTRIRTELGVIDLNPEAIELSAETGSTVLLNKEGLVSQERAKVASISSKYELVQQLNDDQIIGSMAMLEIPDPTIMQTLPEYQKVEAELKAMLEMKMGPQHPRVKALTAQREELKQRLALQIVMVRKTLESNLKIAKSGLTAIELDLENLRNENRTDKTRNAPYYEAKSNYVQARRIYEAVKTQLTTERMKYTMPEAPVTIWEKATPSQYPVRPRVILNMTLAVVFGFIFGIGLAFFIEYLDTSVKTMDEIESVLQVPLLAVIPQNISILIDDTDDNPDAEGYRIMRTNIEFNRKNPDANTVTIVSGGPGEGKSTTLNNLATVFARGGYTTLLVDADFRRPSQHRIFGVQNSMGLSDYLTRGTAIEELIRPTKEDNLFFMPSGKLPTDAVGVLNSRRMLDLIDTVKSRFDIVFFDSPPILGVSDASVICSAVDLTMIVVQHRRYPRSVLQRVKQSVTNVGGNIIGVVLNNVDVRQDSQYAYYTSYYDYYHKAARDQKTKAATSSATKMANTEGKEVEKISRDNEDY